MDFLDEENPSEPHREEPRPRRRERERPRRQPRRGGGGPPNRQLLMRRAGALGLGLLVLILLALAVRGCLNAREDRAIRDYVRDASSIVTETASTSEAFFSRLSDRGGQSVTEFIDEVNADRSAVDAFLSRVQSLDVPDDMQEAHNALTYTYEMRSEAMNVISDELRTALGEQGRERAVRRITRQMSVLYSSDYLYALMYQAKAQRVLEERGINDTDIPTSQFVPDGTEWLSESQVGDALGVSGLGSVEEADDNLTHGTGLLSTSINGTELVPDSTTTITTAGETPDLTVQLQNQGEAEEEGIEVSVTLGDGTSLSSTLDTLQPGSTEAVTIPLTPTPTGVQSVEVEIQPVPGEQVLENNTGTYEVDFG